MIFNLCPHTIHLFEGDLIKYSFKPSGVIARCEEITSPIYILDEDRIPVVNKSYGEVKDLPEEREGIYYIVSMMVRNALPDRMDLLSPGDMVRDAEGKILGCKNFVQN
jgi:hypothetical protein